MVTRSSENSTRFLLSGLSNMCGGAGESFNFDVSLRECFTCQQNLRINLSLLKTDPKSLLLASDSVMFWVRWEAFSSFFWRVSCIPHLYPYPRVQVKPPENCSSLC